MKLQKRMLVILISIFNRNYFKIMICIILTNLILSNHALSESLQEMTGSNAVASSSNGGSESEVQINIQNSDIRTFIQWMAKRTKKNFIIDPRVKGQVSVISQEGLNPKEVYDVFLSVLQVHGFSAIETDQMIKIIPDVNAKSSGIPLAGDQDTVGDQVVIQIVRTKNISPAQIVTLLKPFVPPTGHFVAVPNSNALIISDRAGNIAKIIKVIERVDEAGGLDVDIVQLKNANAKDVIALLTSLLPKSGVDGAPNRRLALVADMRSNSILMVGDPLRRKRLKEIIGRLDEAKQRKDIAEVLYLYYVKASEIAPILQNLSESVQKTDKNINVTEVPVSIQANDATNSLIVYAPPVLMDTLKNIVSKLDIQRAQVLVEAIIVEVGDRTLDELGVQWNTGPQAVGGDGFFGGTRTTTTNIEPLDSDSNLVNLASGITLGFYKNGTIRSLIKALETDDNSNILSKPNIMTLDNEEAEIIVGENVPFVTGSETNQSSSTSNPFQTIVRQDVGVTLRITPQINEGDALTLDVYQEISSISNNTTASDIITNKRSIKTRVLIQNNEILVLGGLISDTERKSVSSVPLLGSIPVLGALFRSKKVDIEKTNLMVFIRPIIVHNAEEASMITGDRYRFIRDKQMEYHDMIEQLNDDNVILLPEL